MHEVQAQKTMAIDPYFMDEVQVLGIVAIHICSLESIFKCVEGFIFVISILSHSFNNFNRVHLSLHFQQ